MQRGRPAPKVELTQEERATLDAWTADPKQAAELALRARIVLCCAEGATNMEVARRLSVTRETAGKWRRRFVRDGMRGLLDEPRPGAPSTIRDVEIERVRELADNPPPNGGPWTTRSMARQADLSQTAISRIWKLFTLEPHTSLPRHFPQEGLCLERVRYVAGLYLDPPVRALALCYDPGREPEPCEASDETAAEPRPSDAGGSIFARLDAHVRKATGHVVRARQEESFLPFLQAVERELPDGCAVHLILGSCSLQKLPEVRTWLSEHERYATHLIPTSGAWLKLVERWAGELQKRSGNRERGGVAGEPEYGFLQRAVQDFLRRDDGIGERFQWHLQRAAELQEAAQ